MRPRIAATLAAVLATGAMAACNTTNNHLLDNPGMAQGLCADFQARKDAGQPVPDGWPAYCRFNDHPLH